MSRTFLKGRTPTRGLLLALVITLCSVVLYSWYIRIQIAHLRQVQSDLVDRNRKDSLQLLRIQNNLNGVALAMRDMVEGDEPYPMTAWEGQFRRLRMDLEDAMQLEDQLAVAHRTTEQRQYLANSVAQFWSEVDQMFRLANEGKTKEATAMIRPGLETRQAGISNAVARLLVENNQSEEQAARQIEEVYSKVERQVYLFLAATLTAILVTGILLFRSNRQLFRQLEELSEQRSDLAQKLIATQESTLLHVSRELHDEFGQILTAVGSLLSRVEKKAPADAAWSKDLHEVRGIVQDTLENVRSLSQSLHPVMLDEAGVESALDWYLSTVERQNGIKIHYEKSGISRPVSNSAGIHIYRITQEALNNVVRHSKATLVHVRLGFRPEDLLLEVEDNGMGMQLDQTRRGIGMVAMRERAELLGGSIQWLPSASGGTVVRLEIPQEQLD
ncbi:MAG TPA: sensor histidine kinase [Terriglobales bacterium]